MNPKRIAWLVAGGVVLGMAGVLRWQSIQAAELRRQADIMREQSVERAQLEADNTRLRASLPSDEALAALREDRTALDKLHEELRVLKAGRSSQAAAPDDARTEPPPQPELLAADWKPVGRATPSTAVQTLLWARRQGNVDVLAAGLVFESDAARVQAESLLSLLPAEWGAHRDSPERLIALLAARDGGYDSIQGMQIVDERMLKGDYLKAFQKQHPDVSELTVVSTKLRRESGGQHPSASVQRRSLTMQKAFDGWKLVIPKAVVEGYAAQLAGGGDAR